jgi:hypothetical protein
MYIYYSVALGGLGIACLPPDPKGHGLKTGPGAMENSGGPIREGQNLCGGQWTGGALRSADHSSGGGGGGPVA